VTSRLEYKRHSLRDAYAQSEFLSVLHKAVPDSVKAELDLIKLDDVAAWATRHGINAPCVIESFSSYCEGGWTKYHQFESSGSWRGPEIPRSWLERIGEWDRRPVNRWWTKGVYADVFDWNQTERLALRKSDPDRWKRVSKDPFFTPAAEDRCYGPISGDPARESLDDFMARARLHWQARARVASRFGFKEAGSEGSWPNLKRDCEWLVRYQFGKETYQSIGGLTQVEAVKKATDRLARAIGLKRPRGRAAAVVRRRGKGR
jgi:hypothetical protein